MKIHAKRFSHSANKQTNTGQKLPPPTCGGYNDDDNDDHHHDNNNNNKFPK